MDGFEALAAIAMKNMYSAVQSGRILPMFRRNILLPPSGSKTNTRNKPSRSEGQAMHPTCKPLLACFVHGLLFDPEIGDRTFLRNIGEILPHCTPLYCKRWYYLKNHIMFDVKYDCLYIFISISLV